jgi:signal transduction histidine kinase/ligand-binding sensor domain-containing protein/DNA-binding response OmpR family regulator
MSKTCSVKNCFFVFVFLFFLSAVNMHSFAQAGSPGFKRLNTDEGLSQGHVSAILKDHNGFMWFATDEGLNKYDGYKFTVYKYDADKSTSISSNFVYDVLEDKSGILWVATANGLDKFDREKDIFIHYRFANSGTVGDIFQDSKQRIWLCTTNGLYLFNAAKGSFKCYKHDTANTNSLSNNFIYRIAEDNDGELWVATKDGLNKFNPEKKLFLSYKNEPGNSKSIGASWIKTVYKDSKGNIWVGTQGSGIALFNRKENSFVNFRHDDANSNSISHNDILSFAESNDGKLWIGTENGGISVLDYATNSFTCYKYNLSDNNSLSNNSVYSLYRDDIGNMWAGTWSGGVNLMPRHGDKFRHYKQTSDNKNGLSSNIILTINGDSVGNLWIGTDGGGMNRFDRKSQTFYQYRHDNKNKNSIGSDYVLSIIEVEPGILCIGYHRGGFDLFNTNTGVFEHHIPEKNNPNSLKVLTVNVVLKDHEGKLWLGTWGGGLNVYDRKSKRFTFYQNNPGDSNTVSSNFIHSISEDKSGNILVGTEFGLDIFDRKSNQFIHYRNQPGNPQSLGNNMVESMFKDHAGNTWLGTAVGLNLFDEKNKKFTAYTEKDGLANNMMAGILEDNHGNLWISSNQGLTKFNPVSKVCRIYNTSDGLQGNEFKSRSVYKAPDGEMFFGGPNGFNSFYPDSIRDNDFIPPVFLTDFQLFNKQVFVGDRNDILQQGINETKEITLSYKQSVFTIEFAALNYVLPEKNQYAYKLEGFDKDWNLIGNKRSATYTNLDAGDYTFRVMGSNNDGLWNKNGTVVKIIITPPFWQTWWFRLVLLISIIVCAFAFYRYRINTMQKQKKELQRQVEEQTGQLIEVNEAERTARREAEKSRHESETARLEADEANMAKSIFLATMSHEIRTPMNGVIGMASLLDQTELSNEQKGYVQSISTCGESLLNVINDILDFSKIESGKMELESKDFDLRTCIEEVLDVFAGKAADIGLDLVYEIDANVPAQIIGDSLRLRQVLMNLVSNAIKFTQKGEIFVKVHLLTVTAGDELEVSFEVQDTGIGIPADKMERLFKAFSQVDSSTTRKYGGTGLGLVICEKLTAMMGGKITVNSEPGHGTCFTFTIQTVGGSKSVPTYIHYDMNGIAGKKVLVIDDNTTNLCILKNQLEHWKLVPTLANSGAAAIDILSLSPGFDLVLTDMQMPEMDGIELAGFIRQKFPQLPIILLSSIGDHCLKEHPGLFRSILTKPIKQHILCKNILNELQKPGPDQKMEEQNVKQKLSVDFAKQYPLHLLVAEDNLINQQLILKILSMLGYESAMAENGAEVLEMLNQDQYDIILMDVQMPEMDGLEATKQIRNNEKRQPVIIAMTANAMQGDKEECLQAGMDDYLTKPVKLDDFVNMLKKWAGKILINQEISLVKD